MTNARENFEENQSHLSKPIQSNPLLGAFSIETLRLNKNRLEADMPLSPYYPSQKTNQRQKAYYLTNEAVEGLNSLAINLGHTWGRQGNVSSFLESLGLGLYDVHLSQYLINSLNDLKKRNML